MTLNLAALLAAERAFLAVAGAAKGEVLDRAKQGPSPALPVSLVLANQRRGLDVFRA